MDGVQPFLDYRATMRRQITFSSQDFLVLNRPWKGKRLS